MLARRVRTRTLSSVLAVALALTALGRPFLLCAGIAHTVLPAAQDAHGAHTAHAAHAAHTAHAAQHDAHAGNAPVKHPPTHGHGLDECCTVCASACGGCSGAGATSLAIVSPSAVRTIRPLRVAALPPAERAHVQPFPIGPPAPLVV